MGIQPSGEALRRAVKWVSDQRRTDPEATVANLVAQAALQFNLSPKDAAFLQRTLVEGDKDTPE